ncbi:translation initiation factor IF-2-like protein [Labeo rohita]|uniref:Translation initiation factor IF-2-like protein n=1 Tax=Labeo rohita TaxID=84645 RepID=A0A498L515_LABRO|nr:translation initiation factor IF-2-like protein [Labeo rohita]
MLESAASLDAQPLSRPPLRPPALRRILQPSPRCIPAPPPLILLGAVSHHHHHHLASSGVIIPRRSTKADLLDLYASLQAGENLNSTPPSRASGRACTGRSAPYSRPEQTTTPPRTEPLPSSYIIRAASHCPPPTSSERELAAHAGGEPVFASTSRHSGVSPPPPAEKSRSQLLPRYSPNPVPYPWPAVRAFPR